jgi:hypothetical protein
MDTQSRGSSALSYIFTFILILTGMIALFYLYKFLYGTMAIQTTMLVSGETLGTQPPTTIPPPPQLYEGGDYSVSMWVYINSYNINRNKRKHILEIGGTQFATLLIGLGAFKNTLLVRTHSRDTDMGTVSGSSSSDASGNTSTPQQRTPLSDEATRMDGSLFADDLTNLFKPLAMDDSLIDASPMCDLPEIDMQRWALVSVVLSGRVIDVYLDGKLARSCVTKSYFKVDPTGVSAKLLKEGGFDGHVSNVAAYNYALTPSEVYRIYQAGPSGSSNSVLSWFSALFGGAK